MWDKMEVFYRVVKAGSFTKAEQVLNKSQGTLSRSVAILEERLDARLLRRKIKGLELTRKGEEVFKAAQRMFVEMDGIKTLLNEEDGMQGKIRISTTYAIGNYLLTDPLINFSHQYPEIDIELICNDNILSIIQNEVDLSIRPQMDDADEDLKLCLQEHLLTITSGLYASAEYLEKYGTPKVIKDLDDHQLLTRSRPHQNPYSSVDWVLKVGRENLEPRKPFYTSNSVESLFEAAEKGMGITLGYQEMKNVQKSSLIRVLPDINTPRYKEYLTYPNRLKSSEKIKMIREFLLEKFKEKRY